MPNTRGKRKEILPVDEVMDTNKTVADETTNTTSNIIFSSKKGIVKCSKLNVRKEPTKGSDILKIISEGTEVEILKTLAILGIKFALVKLKTVIV